MCAEKTRRLEASRDDDFSPRVRNSGGNWRASPFWRFLVGRVTFSARQLPSSCHPPSSATNGGEQKCHSNFWILDPEYSHSWIPHSKGDDDPCSFPRRLHSPQSARPRPSPSLACRVALMDLTAEKHYSP